MRAANRFQWIAVAIRALTQLSPLLRHTALSSSSDGEEIHTDSDERRREESENDPIRTWSIRLEPCCNATTKGGAVNSETKPINGR